LGERGAAQSSKRSPYDRPVKRALDPDDDLPLRAPRDRAERGKAVTASGGMVTPPARRSPGRSSRPFLPQKRPGGKDLFFEDMETPAENFYDEAMEERALAHRIKGIVTIALLVGVLMVAIWLMWTPGGQMVRAQLNLGAPATAYKALGDQDRAGGQVKQAADAYYNALRLDPKNYEYAMLVGQTQEMVGTDESRKKAAIAYGLCIQLKPQEVQPYKLLVDLYRVMGNYDAAEACRAEGYKQTGDASLAASN
jgi:tetratricopeptide (TPR) repeat protein